MRVLWIVTFLVPLILSLTASEAAQEMEERVIQPISAEAIYVGPVLDDAAFGQRVSSGGGIDVYNVWTSFLRPKEKANGDIAGHSYQICKNGQFFVAHVIFFRPSSGQVRINLSFSKAAKKTNSYEWDLTIPGYWVLWVELRTANFPNGYYKLLAKYNITRGVPEAARRRPFST